MTRPNAARHNYAQVNLRGFNSTKSTRSKKKVKRRALSAAQSPLDRSKQGKRGEISLSTGDLNAVAKKLQIIKDGEIIMCNGANTFIASPMNKEGNHDKSKRGKNNNGQGTQCKTVTIPDSHAYANTIHSENNTESIHAGKNVYKDKNNEVSIIADTNSEGETMTSLQEKKQLAREQIAKMEAELQELEG